MKKKCNNDNKKPLTVMILFTKDKGPNDLIFELNNSH